MKDMKGKKNAPPKQAAKLERAGRSPGLQMLKSMAPPMLSIFWMMAVERAAGAKRTGLLLWVRWRTTVL